MGAKEREQNPGAIPFVNNVEGRNASRNVGKKWSAPFTLILFLIFGGAALFLGGQSVLGAHISNLFTKATDVQFTSYDLRSQRLFKYMLDGGDQIRVTPFSKQFTYFTPWMKNRLASNNIEVVRINHYGDPIPDDLLATGLPRALRYGGENGKIITAANFQNEYFNDTNFREAYYQAKRGRIAGFFDDSSERVYRKLGISRNIFADFKPSNDSAASTAKTKEILGTRLGGASVDVNSARHETDDDGNRHTVPNDNDVSTSNTPGNTPESKAREYANRLTGKVSNAAGGVCAAVQVAQIANITYFAAYTFNAINYAMGLNENISKMLAGQGNASAFNDVMNFFTATTTSEIVSVDASGNTTVDAVTGSMLQAPVSRLVLGGIVPTQYETGSFSLESITNTAQRAVLIHGGGGIACNTIQAGAAIVSLVSVGAPGGFLAKAAIGMVAQTVGGITITVAMASVMSVIIPHLASALFSDVIETHTGVLAGNLYGTGVAAGNFAVAQKASAQTPGDGDTIGTNARITSSVLAREAELDRLNRSPFDITSSNTFLGSLVAGFLPLHASSSPTSTLSIFGSLTSSAISSLLPAAFATEASEPTYTTTFGDCPTLEKIGAKGTVDCLAIPTFDPSTIDISPIPDDPNYDPNYEAIIMRNMSADASAIINNSELAKFITFCTERESPWGITDANILNALQTDYGVILNNLPFLNDVVMLVNAAEDTTNMGWATGKYCTNTPNNPRWDNEYKYYQRFIEDTRILGQMGAYEDGGALGVNQNPVLAFLDKYYTEHPLDNSPQGYLARITGMTTDDIAFLLEFINYSNFLAEYNPSDLYPVLVTPEEKTEILVSSNSSIDHEQGTTPHQAIYSDVRNRSYAI